MKYEKPCSDKPCPLQPEIYSGGQRAEIEKISDAARLLWSLLSDEDRNIEHVLNFTPAIKGVFWDIIEPTFAHLWGFVCWDLQVSFHCPNQYCGSMTFWCGSGSADPCLWLMDPDPDPAIFVIDPSRCKQKSNFKKSFSAYYFRRNNYIIFQRLKVQKMKQSIRNQGFSYYFCLVIEGSGSGSITLNNGSGSGYRRPKNIRIRRIRIWIRIRNTGTLYRQA